MMTMTMTMVKNAKLKIDLMPTIIKVLACFVLFVGMILASYEEMEKVSFRKPPPVPRGVDGELTVPKAYVLIDSYAASYICITMVVILLEIGNICISAMGGINKLGDSIWQTVNAFLAFCVALMWCVVVQFWRTNQLPVNCSLNKQNERPCHFFHYSTYSDLFNWLSMILAFYSGLLFIVAAVFNMIPEEADKDKIGNVAVAASKTP